MEHWEYCIVNRSTAWAASAGMSPSTTVRIEIEGQKRVSQSLRADEWMEAFVRLGAEGWQLVTVTATLHIDERGSAQANTAYFKRQTR